MNLNPHVSVDCVIFGFHQNRLKVLLIERETVHGLPPGGHKLKLPGSLISETEDLESSAIRVLQELTGLQRIYLKQFGVFGDPGRLSPLQDLEWLRITSGLKVERVVTIAYYSLIKIDDSKMNPQTIWHPVDELPVLIFDHNAIIASALEALRNAVRTQPVCFELLPQKFTIRQMHDLYAAILAEPIDSRNFRKKVRGMEFLVPLPEKEKDVNHKPAQIFRFDKKLYNKHRKAISGFDL